MLVFAMPLGPCSGNSHSACWWAAYVIEDKRPDIHAFFPDDRVMLDVCVSHPLLLLVSVLRLVLLFVIVRMPRLRHIALLLRIPVVVLCLLRLSLSAPGVLQVWRFCAT